MSRLTKLNTINMQPKSTLKILLKIKNDSFFLERWINHHTKIVGSENLIIIDNDSTNKDTLTSLEKAENDIAIFSYTGFHNDLHRPYKNKELYQYLENNTKYFIFLDTDEFLEFYDADGVKIKPKEAISQLSTCTDSIIFGKWLQCTFGNKNQYYLKSDPNDVALGIKSGKPILKPSSDIDGIINHNFQAIEYYKNSTTTFPYAFVKHQKFENYQQRINSNYEKLLAYNAFKHLEKNPSLEEITKIDPDSIQEGNARNWTKEIIKLSKNLNSSSQSKDGDIIELNEFFFKNQNTINNYKKFFNFSSPEYKLITNPD